MAVRSSIQTSRSGTAFPSYANRVGAHAAHARDRAFDGPDHIRDRDLGRVAGEPVATVGAALASDETAVPQVGEDVLEELLRDRLGSGEPLSLDLSRCHGSELDHRPERVVDLG